MFRKMRRFKQQLEQKECIEVLKSQPRGVLSILGEDGYPYGIPIDYWYCEEENRIYFHGAKEGHKIDAIKECDKASFCVYDEGYREEGEWALNIKSVIIFGRIRLVEEQEKSLSICRELCFKFTDDEEYIQKDFDGSKIQYSDEYYEVTGIENSKGTNTQDKHLVEFEPVVFEFNRKQDSD